MANKLLEILTPTEAIKFNIKTGAGRMVPVYWDPKVALSNPVALRLVAKEFSKIARHNEIELIAGGETGGISLAAVTALYSGLLWVYIRKHAKGYSTNSLIEGGFKKDAKTILLDDLLATGQGKDEFFRNASNKLDIKTLAVILDDSAGDYIKSLQKRKIKFVSLFKMRNLLDCLYKTGKINSLRYQKGLDYIKYKRL